MAKLISRTQRSLPGVSSSARSNVNTDTGEGQIGAATAAVGGQLQRIGGEIEQRHASIMLKRQQMTDANESTRAKSIRDIADADFESFKTVNQQGDWQKKRQELNADVTSQIAGLNLSPAAMETEGIRTQAWGGLNERKALGAATRQLQTDTIDSLTDSMTNAFRSGSALDQAEAATTFSENGANMGKDKNEILADIKAAQATGMELRNKDAVEAINNEAVSSPEATLARSLKEQELRKEGKGEISETELSDTDLVSAERIAKNRIDEIKRNSQEAVNKAQSDEENKMFEGLDDGSKTTADVVGSKILDVAQKRKLLDDEAQFTKMDLNSSWPLTDNDAVVQDLNTKLTDQSSGQTDINEMNKSINDAAASGKLTKETRDKMRASAKKGGLDAIDEQVNASTVRVKNALIGRLSAREARFKVAELSRDLTRDEQRQARSVGFLSQVGFEQLNRFNAELNKRMRETGKETLSGVEVESLSAQVWDKYKKKDDAQKIREFMEFTGQRVPMPDGFSASKWNSVTPATRANIVAGSAAGMTNEQIEAMITK